MTLVMTYYESDVERVMWEQHITGKKKLFDCALYSLFGPF